MKNLNNVIRSRAARFVSLRVVLILFAAMLFAGFGVASAWNGGFSWLSIRTASAESKVASNAVVPPSAPAPSNATEPLIMATTVTTNGGSGLAATYPDLISAITALNAATITSPVVITVSGTETAPAGGYSITATGTAVNTIVINGGGGGTTTITAPTPQTVGNLNDAIFKIIGGDFITIDGFTMLENAGNTISATSASNNMTEWGVALLYATSTNGAQNCVIQNNTITLNRTYLNTFGIYSNSTHTATAVTTSVSATTTAGGNSGLKIFGNTVSNVNQGIVVVGPTAAADYNTGLDIGGTGGAQANNVTNWGTGVQLSTYANVSGTINGVLVRNSIGFNVSFNTITSSVGGNTATASERGIYVPSFSNTPTGTFTDTINSNNISVQSGFVTGTLNGIIVETATGTATSSISISSNNFNTFGHTVASPTGAVNFINDTMANLNTTINSNTFTAITLTTTGSVLFIGHSLTNPAGGIDNISSNMIVTSFTKTGTGGGTLTFINNSAGSSTTVTQTWNSNNFSNITIPGATIIAGMVCTDGGTVNHKCNNNTISNIVGGTGSITGILSNFGGGLGGNGNEVIGNTITNISSAGAITGVNVGGSGSTTTVSSNTIGNFSTTGASAVVGITSAAPTSATISKNKIYDLGGTNAGTTVNGIAVTSGVSHTISNNIVGNLTASAATITSPGSSIIGINLTSTTTSSAINVYFNTVYINATSSGANFATTGIFHAASATATTATLTLRNNIIDNRSTPSGTGFTVVYRRSVGTAGTLANYASASNNNDFFLGTAGANKFLYSDGTSTAATIGAYKAGVFTAGTISPRDSASVSDPTYLSTTGTDAAFLHMDPAVPTQVESGGTPVAGITDDFDGQTRNASTPDIGADEFSGIPIDLSPPAISYTPFPNTTLTTNRTLVVTISDATGVASGALAPRIYFRRLGDPGYVSTQCMMTGGTAQNGTYNCTIDYSLLTPPTASTGDVIQYFVVAQDTVGTPNVGANPNASFSATSVNSITTPPSNPNSYTIVTGFASTVTVGGGGTYPSLTNVGGLFEAMNAGIFTGNTTVSIVSNLTGETGTVALNQLAEEGAGAGTFTVTIKPDTTARTVTGSGSGVNLIKLNGADRVTIDGSLSGGTDRSLTFSNPFANTSATVIWIASTAAGNPATSNTVKNCTVSGATNQTTLADIVSSGSVVGGIAEAANSFNTYQNNAITTSFYGIALVGPTGNEPGNKITGNNIGSTVAANKIGFNGIAVFQQASATVSKNIIAGVVESTSSTLTASGIRVSGGASGISIDANRISDIKQPNTTGWGCNGIHLVSSSTTANVTVSNNFISDVAADGFAASSSQDNGYGIMIDAGAGYKIYHNSVNMNTNQVKATGVPAAINIAAAVTTVGGLDIRNNIFAVSATVGVRYAIIDGPATPAIFSMIDYNDYFATNVGGTGGSSAGPPTTTLTSLGAWQGFSLQDANSRTDDPMFVTSPAPADLHLQAASPMLGACLLIPGIDSDVDSDLRDDMPDIGADEIVSGRTGIIPPGTYRDGVIGPGSLGSNVTFQGNVTLTGVVTTGPNTLIIDCGGSVSGASDTNYVDGNVQKNFCSTPTTFSFPVGDPAANSAAPTNGYMPVTVTVTALGVNPSSLTVNANNGLAPSAGLNPATTLSAYWTLTEAGDLTANLSFNYDQGDVNGVEANYRVIQVEGTTPINYPSTVLDTTNNIASVNGITNFSDWTVGEPFAPTNVTANISGHVVNNTGGPLAGVTMTLLDTILVENRTTVTDANGAYFFDAILTGRQIVVTPSRNGYTFNPQNRVFNHIGDLATVDFTGTADGGQVRSIDSDYDGDGRTDLAVFRPSDASWYILLSSNNTFKSQQWGLGTDRIVPADYDGDHITDIAVFRPSTGTWYISQSSTSTMRAVNWGLADDVVTPADFDGDGQADIAVFRPSTGTWYIIDSHNGQARYIAWGTNGDRPVAADYDGDGKAECAVFRPSNGIWYVLKSDGNFTYEHWGIEEDRQVVGDYDGDHKADLAVFRPSTATWYVKLSSDNSISTRGHGTAADILTPGDYDGDGKTDRAVWQLGGDWNILRSSTNTTYGQKWGTTGDIPVGSAYVR